MGVCLAFSAHAGFSLGDASDFAVLYEGNGGNQLQFNNSTITGDVGIGLTGQAQLNGPGVISGALQFSAPNTGQYSDSGVTVGSVGYNDATVTTALSAVNDLSMSLGTESGTSLTVNGNTLINASSGTLDGSGNEVFTVASHSDFSLTTSQTLTISGTANQYVVINLGGSGGYSVDGNIVLTGGITSDHVLFNFTGGNYATLTGGNTLQISANGDVLTGVFLDPNGNMQINNATLDGQFFGGDTQNMNIVSGANIVFTPSVAPVPESSTIFSGLLLLVPLGMGVARGLLRNREAKTAGIQQ